MNPLSKLKHWERNTRLTLGHDLSDPVQRRRAFWQYQLLDHAFLRHWWTNFDQIAPGVYRSNQPSHRRFERYAAMGIKSVLNLRGAAHHARYLFEKETVDALGLTMINVSLQARKAPAREAVQALIAAFRQIGRPFLMHCKSGADRAGLASAIYLMVIEGKSVEEARKMLSPRYIHFRWSKTGVLDHLLDVYAARNSASPIGFEEWIATEYDASAVQAGFDASRRKRRT